MSTHSSTVIAVSLDMEKTFDQIEWTNLFYTLSRYGFGPRCLQWIRALYHEPVLSVKSNGQIFAPFQLCSSTSQGCLLSPLDILALKPLACAILRDITGVLTSDLNFKTKYVCRSFVYLVQSITHHYI